MPWVFLVLALFQVSTRAEDIDVFVGASPSSSGTAANVLIILDNTANWNQQFTDEIAALVNTFGNLSSGAVNVGLTMFSETGTGNSNVDGGYVRAAIRNMSLGNKQKYAQMIAAFDKTGDASNGGKAGKTMQEAYLYLSGLQPLGGAGKLKADYMGNASSNNADRAVWSLPGNALGSMNAGRYTSPVAATPSCGGKNFIIYISNGAAQDPASDVAASLSALAGFGGDTSQISISPVGSANNPSDEWARFMKKSSLGVTTYTVEVDKDRNGQGPGWTALLKSMSQVSGGKYFDVSQNAASLESVLTTVFAEIQSVNSVFASAALPLASDLQGQYLNQVFLGMFRPDSNSLPLWPGNLKQYKMGLVGGELKLLDASGADALNTQTGFITECARSFWTPSASNSYWSGKGWPIGTNFCSDATKASDTPDGSVVEKGGEAYVLRQATGSRVVKTCGTTMASCSGAAALVDLDAGSVTPAQLAVSTTGERDVLLSWVHGIDVQDEDLDGNIAERRRSIHGDVVHSRPVAVNFGTSSMPEVVVFYGGNDGLLRAVNGNTSRNLGSTSVAPGAELWTFAAPEFLGKFKRLFDNTTRIKVPGDGSTTSAPKDYGVDGPITAFRGAVNSVTKSFIYATMRRGGAAAYAFDVSDALTAPSAPKLKWKAGCSGYRSGDCTMGMSGIGQTWSAAKTFYASGYASGQSPLVIFGGGYDTCEDADPHTCTAAGYVSKGGYVYVLDGDTGGLLATFATGQRRGVIADLTIVPDANNRAIYAYAADLGGNVYRITLGSGAASTWRMDRIASFGCDTPSACTSNRKFMFAPSVVALDGNYVVMLGSGDREKPTTAYASSNQTQNYFFQFLDKPSVDPAVYPGNGCGANLICIASLVQITGTANPTQAALASSKGWALALAAGEQVVTSALTIYGTVTFSTHQPNTSTSSCTSSLGTARVYNIDYRNAAPVNNNTSRWDYIPGGGLVASPVGGRVKLDDGREVTFRMGGSRNGPESPELAAPPATAMPPKNRLYWYIQK